MNIPRTLIILTRIVASSPTALAEEQAPHARSQARVLLLNAN
jgi:hypothetical protein